MSAAVEARALEIKEDCSVRGIISPFVAAQLAEGEKQRFKFFLDGYDFARSGKSRFYNDIIEA